jgi:drug/metabolite transporter (DMT)-like permease
MLYLILSILLSVLLLVNFRFFPKFGISTWQAISFNYVVCFATGWLLMPQNESFVLDFSANWTYFALAMGVGFILAFVLSGLSTQRSGITLTSLANNLSLVIPVLFSLLVFKTSSQFTLVNYLGLALALVAVGISTYQPGSSDSAQPGKSWGLILGVFLMYGCTNTGINFLNLYYIPNPNQVIPVTLVMVLGACLSGAVLLVYRVIRQGETLAWRNGLAALTLGVPNFLSFFYLIKALGAFQNNGALVYPLYNIGVIVVSAVVGRIFFKEKLKTLNWIGMGLALVSIALISWQAFY